MRHNNKSIWIVIFTIIIVCTSRSLCANNYQLGLYECIGISNIDYPGHGKNPNFVFSFEIGGTLEKKLSNFIKLGTGIRFQKTGYLQKNGFYVNELIPIDIGINDYRVALPFELHLAPQKNIPLSIIIGIENSFKLTRDYIIRPNIKDYQIDFGKPSIYNINFEIGIRGNLGKDLTLGILYKRGLNAVYQNVNGFNLNMIGLTASWNFYNF